MTASPLKKLLYSIVVLSALLTTNGIAQSCSSGTTTISTTQTSSQTIGQSNSCLVITSSGSIVPPAASETVTSEGVLGSITGVSITNNGRISNNLTANSTAVYGILNTNSSSISSLINTGIIQTSVNGTGSYVFGITNNGGTITTLNNTGSISTTGGTNLSSIYNDSGGIITTLSNSGSITSTGSSDSGIGINNRDNATITTLTNSGSITGTATGSGKGYGIYNGGTITTLNNTGSITGTATVSGNAFGYAGTGTITTLNNTGSITGRATGSGAGYGILNYVSITTLTNSGSISGTSDSGTAYGIVNSGTITTLNNSSSITGTATVSGNASGIFNYAGTITTLNNTGSITGTATGSGDGLGILNYVSITTLTNSGSITGTASGSGKGYGIRNTSSGTIATLTNTGSITGTSASGAAYGIYNQGTITTLNNAQSNLTYTGILPTNYNVIITSASNYGKLSGTSVTGATNFGIYGTPLITARTYSSVLSGIGLPTINTGTYDNMIWALVANGATNYDLTFTGVSLMGTQQSLVNTASALQATYTLQNSVIANSFSYDCTVFGANNVCVSAGGRNTTVQAANGLNNTSALLIAAYRPHPNYRIGAYADQNLSVTNPGGTVNLGNNTPLIGLFGAWNERLNGTGTEVKVSAAYGQKNATVTRAVVGTSEAGSGSSNLISQGAQVTAKYGFAVMDKVIVSPYVGMRYTQNNMNGYTEGTSSSVTAPLTYSALNTNATTALAGVGASYRVIPTVTTYASAGVETDTNTSNGTYSATGVAGLTPVNFNANPVKTRPTATLGAYYDIAKNQRLGVTGIYRQEAYQAVSTTTVMATYTIGL